ncbi:hypothetical protein ACS0TY_017768 [Phlomoides rotata]
MILLSWNCRGLGNQATVRALKKLLHEKNPGIVFLMETKLKYAQMNRLNSGSLKFAGCLPVDCEGKDRKGGLCLLWKEEYDVRIQSFSTNHISADIFGSDNIRSWSCSGIYGWPYRNLRHQTFQLMHRIAPSTDTPWLCLGDFNEILWSWEKKWGNCSRTHQMDTFRQTISDLNLHDLGFQGNKFTWSNNSEGIDNIQVRLDRAFANSMWRVIFPKARVFHLLRFKSDHAPILVDCEFSNSIGARKRRNFERVFRFEKMWLEKDECVEIVAKGWNRENTLLNFLDRTLRCETQLKSWDK